MILVDSSVWIDHLRAGNAVLADLLERRSVSTHPFVIGELALGRLRKRREVLLLLADLPRITLATDLEVLEFIERNDIAGKGVGYIDAHLAAATRLTAGTRLWTRDRALADLATRLGISWS